MCCLGFIFCLGVISTEFRAEKPSGQSRLGSESQENVGERMSMALVWAVGRWRVVLLPQVDGLRTTTKGKLRSWLAVTVTWQRRAQEVGGMMAVPSCARPLGKLETSGPPP